MKIVRRTSDDRGVNNFSPMRSLFDDFFTVPSLFDEMLGKSFTSKNLFADIWEEDDNYVIKMALPGVKKDEINISTSNDSVTIKAESKQEETKDDKKKYYYKSMESSYEQTFNLPARVDADKAEASYQDGVLTLRLPKSDEVKPRRISVN